LINGYFDPRSAVPVPRVRVALFLPGLTTRWYMVDFVIDTGAMTTCVHPKDAIFALNISARRLQDSTRWERHQLVQGVGGSSLNFVVSASYAMLKEDGDGVDIFQQDIDIAQMRAGVNDQIPSVLGWDVLRRYDLTFSWRSKEVRLIPPPAG
jgi:hypothetical protein